jgi:hypothetical protein
VFQQRDDKAKSYYSGISINLFMHDAKSFRPIFLGSVIIHGAKHGARRTAWRLKAASKLGMSSYPLIGAHILITIKILKITRKQEL